MGGLSVKAFACIAKTTKAPKGLELDSPRVPLVLLRLLAQAVGSWFAVVAAVPAAAFGGASGHAAGNEVSSSGAIEWCGCQCISATGAVACVGADVVLVAGELRLKPRKSRRHCRRLINMKGFGSSAVNERNHY